MALSLTFPAQDCPFRARGPHCFSQVCSSLFICLISYFICTVKVGIDVFGDSIHQAWWNVQGPEELAEAQIGTSDSSKFEYSVRKIFYLDCN